MKRVRFVATAFLVGCSAINPLSNHGVLILKPKITAPSYQTKSEVVRYSKSSINHLTLRLFTYDGAEHDLNVQRIVQNADLDNPVSFSGLKSGRTYRVKASAYLTADDSQLISTTASDSYTDILVENNDAPSISVLKVKLIDIPFNAHGTGSIGFIPAQYTYLGDESIDTPVVADLPYNLSVFAGTADSGFFGDGGPATAAQLNRAKRVALDATGNLYVADDYRVRKIDTNGIITTVAGNGGSTFDGVPGVATNESIVPADVAVDADGVLYIADTTNNMLFKVKDGNLSVRAGTGGPGFVPYSVTIGPDGLAYVGDCQNFRIYRIPTEGDPVVVAGNGNFPEVDYVDNFRRYRNADNGLATETPICCSGGITFDADGNLYYADSSNYYIRKVVLGGNISTVAGDGSFDIGFGGQANVSAIGIPWALDFDAAGNLYVANDSNILKIGSDGIIKNIAGIDEDNWTYTGATGLATGISFSVQGVVVAPTGNIYVSDTYAHRVFKLSH